MALTVYACRFDVPGETAWDEAVRPEYERWVAERYGNAFGCEMALDLESGEVAGALPEGHRLEVRRHEADGVAVELEWRFPGERGLVWRNLARLAQLGDRCAVEHRVEIASAEYLVAPAGFALGAPKVIRDLCRHDVLVGGMRVRATVYPLSPNEVDDFVHLLEAEERRLPIVLLTPFANGEPGDLDAGRLADHLAGVAIVAEADTPAATWALSSHIDRLGVYNGGVRVYWPRFRRDDDLRRHPLMLGTRIGLLGPEAATRMIERSIFSVAAFRFTPDERIEAIISRSEAAARARRAQDALGQGGMSWEDYALELARELDEAKRENEGLRRENENLRANLTVLFSSTQDVQEEEGGETPAPPEYRTVADAVTAAREHCRNLIFLDSSSDSAKRSPFRRPTEVYEALRIMDRVAAVWARNPGDGDLVRMLKDGGLGRRVTLFISQTAKGK